MTNLSEAQQKLLDAAKEGQLVRGRGNRYTAYGWGVLPSTVKRLVDLGLITWEKIDDARSRAVAT